jgi:hypothetical protein
VPAVPKTGIKLTYKKGETCHEGEHREVSYEYLHSFSFSSHLPRFVCDTTSNNKPVDVKELGKCKYAVSWPTQYGCPVASFN